MVQESVEAKGGAGLRRKASATDERRRAELARELSAVERSPWRRRLIWLAVLIAIGLGAGVAWTRTRPPPEPRYVLEELTEGDVLETVQSTGQVKPTTEVQVGAQVSGRIAEVYVDFNSEVKQGDVLAEIDPQLFDAQIASTRAQMAATSANVARAQASEETAKRQLDRMKDLVKEGLGSQADLDAARGSYDVAVAELAAAKAQVAQIGAQLESSRTNLEYTRIFSPIDGVVVNRAIDPGQTVAASFQSPTLFVIAQDLAHMRVLADIDEADVGKVDEGMKAVVSVDAFPGDRFEGSVRQVRYSPINVSGVVTYAAVIDVENEELKLRPGMTATVTIHSAEAKGVRRLPNAALRFKPVPPKDADGKPIPQDPLPKLGKGKARVHVLVDDTPGHERTEVREVEVGITDGSFTELKSELDVSKVVVDEVDDEEAEKKRRGLF